MTKKNNLLFTNLSFFHFITVSLSKAMLPDNPRCRSYLSYPSKHVLSSATRLYRIIYMQDFQVCAHPRNLLATLWLLLEVSVTILKFLRLTTNFGSATSNLLWEQDNDGVPTSTFLMIPGSESLPSCKNVTGKQRTVRFWLLLIWKSEGILYLM